MSMSKKPVSSSSVNDLVEQMGEPAQAPPAREKTKRPQLSCNPCRTRKVKCDRVQPCTACSLHQIADDCHYDLTESERHPILQAEALREKEKEILRLRRVIESLGGEPVDPDSADAGSSSRAGQETDIAPRVPKKPASLRQKRLHKGNLADSIYFGAPGMASVIEEFANLSIEPKAANLTYAMPRGTDIFAFQMATSHPFPTLWPAKDGAAVLIQLLPSKDEIFLYLDAFQQRAQSCSFPHVPEECTKKEVERFLANVEHNALVHPDMLALLFTTLAQGLQSGVYDRGGGQWVAGAMDEDSKKGDVYIAAAMQALRTASFMSRPSLLAIQTLIMICPYLTNSGKFLDAWALFGVTIRLAQSIGLHRDPGLLNPPTPLEEVPARKNLWWWMLHMDAQYSMTLGRPLGISSMGDCPAPEALIPDPVVQNLGNYIGQFTIIARQILSIGYLSNHEIDSFTDQLLALKHTLPESIQFDESWLNNEKVVPPWPLDAQATVFYGKTHNFLILLNRQRLENTNHEKDSAVDLSTEFGLDDSEKVPRGRERVLQSCRAILDAFYFFQTRLRAAMLCWTMGQQAFNSAMILTISMLETGDTKDLDTVQRAYTTFIEMQRLGVHKLAGSAVEKLGGLMKEFHSGEVAKEPVMSKQGMMLLEDPGLQGFLHQGFAPLTFQMAGSNLQYDSIGTGWAASSAREVIGRVATSSPSAQGASGKKRQRKSVNTSSKPRVPLKKASLRQQWPVSRQRRASGLWMNVGTQAEVANFVGPNSAAPPSDLPESSLGDDNLDEGPPSRPEFSFSGEIYGAGHPYQEAHAAAEEAEPLSRPFQRLSSYGRLANVFGNYAQQRAQSDTQIQQNFDMQQPTMTYDPQQTHQPFLHHQQQVGESPTFPQAHDTFPKDTNYFQDLYGQQAGAPAYMQMQRQQERNAASYAQQGPPWGGYEGFVDEETSPGWGWMDYTAR